MLRKDTRSLSPLSLVVVLAALTMTMSTACSNDPTQAPQHAPGSERDDDGNSEYVYDYVDVPPEDVEADPQWLDLARKAYDASVEHGMDFPDVVPWLRITDEHYEFSFSWTPPELRGKVVGGFGGVVRLKRSDSSVVDVRFYQ